MSKEEAVGALKLLGHYVKQLFQHNPVSDTLHSGVAKSKDGELKEEKFNDAPMEHTVCQLRKKQEKVVEKSIYGRL